MDNITISDLSVKQTLEDSDKFVIRDENNVDQAIAGSALSTKFQAKGDYVTPTSLETTLEDYATKTELTPYKTKRDIITDKKWWDFNELGSGVHTLFYLGQTDTSYKLPSPYCSITVNFLSRARGTAIATDWRNDQNAKSWICQLHDDTNQFNWGSWKELATKEIELYAYNQNNTTYNAEYISAFTIKTFKQNGIIYINIENLQFVKAGINVTNVITGLPRLKQDITIQISNWSGNTGMLRYYASGSITMIWNYNSQNEVTGNATAVLE